jgi:hypothetical protein
VFRNHRNALNPPNLDPPRVRTVRLLQSDEELQAAVERARAFERRDNYHQRRGGAYDHLLRPEAGWPVHVALTTPEDSDKSGVVMVQMARALGQTIIAEGIEDEASPNKERSFGVDLRQGYYQGPPGPLDS